MLKKHTEVLKALQLFIKSISRIYVHGIPLGQPKFIANEPVYSDTCKCVRQNSFWDYTEML